MTETQPFEVVRRIGVVEIRRYPAHVVAEVTVDAHFDAAGMLAFRALFGYISGENRSRRKVAMTAPVLQTSSPAGSTKIAMTAPVVQKEAGAGRHRVAFVLPAGLGIAEAPEPTNPAVSIREVPAALSAAIRFTGRWTRTRFERHLAILRRELALAGLTEVGVPRFARYDPPFLPPFLRRNEVIVDLDEERPGRVL